MIRVFKILTILSIFYAFPLSAQDRTAEASQGLQMPIEADIVIGRVVKRIGKRVIVEKLDRGLKEPQLLRNVKIKLKDGFLEKVYFLKEEDSRYYLETEELQESIKAGDLVYHSFEYKESPFVESEFSIGDFAFILPFHFSRIHASYTGTNYSLNGFGFGIGGSWKAKLGRALFTRFRILKTVASLENDDDTSNFSGVSIDRTDYRFGLGVLFKTQKVKKNIYFELYLNYDGSKNIFEGGEAKGFISYRTRGFLPTLNIVYPVSDRAQFDLTVEKSLFNYRLSEYTLTRGDVESRFFALRGGVKLKKDQSNYARLTVDYIAEENSTETFLVKQTLFAMELVHQF